MVTAARNQKKTAYQPLSTVPVALPITSQWGEVDLSTNVTGTLPVANGGTGVTSSTGSGSTVLSNSPTLVTPTVNTGMTLGAGADIALDTATGTKIGATNAQKLALWGNTPNVQPTTGITAAAFVANTSGIVDDSATFGGYTIGQIVAALKRLGALT